MATHITRDRIRYVPTDTDDLYPETDGKPMAATDIHRRILIWVLQVLEAHFAKKLVYVSGDIMMYYVLSESKTIAVSPDVLITFGIEQKPRRVYRISQPDNPHPDFVEPVPDFVMEFTSKGTHEDDVGRKMEIYAMMGIPDYFLYDAEGLYLPTPLMGFELVNNRYVRIPEGVDGGIHSSALGLDFHLRDEEGLGIYDPVLSEWLRTPAEAATLRANQESIERQAAEVRANQEAARAEQESIARQHAEAEVARLREELERLQTRR